jgi:hypothetical protein
MTDGDVVKIARKMSKIQDELFDLIAEIENSNHPNAEEIGEALHNDCIFFAWPTHVVHGLLECPDAWEVTDNGRLHRHHGVRHKAASSAAAVRGRHGK